jgi:hypothetical protein
MGKRQAKHTVRTARDFLQRAGETYCAELSKADVLAVFAASSKLAATTRHARAMALKRILRYLPKTTGVRVSCTRCRGSRGHCLGR